MHKLEITKLPMAVVKPGNQSRFGRSIEFYIQKVNSDVNYIPVVIPSETNDEGTKDAKPVVTVTEENK